MVLNIYEDELRSKLFDEIVGFCEKIKFLHLKYIGFMNISQLSRMILNFSDYLKYLTLEIKFYNYTSRIPFDAVYENNLEVSSKMVFKR